MDSSPESDGASLSVCCLRALGDAICCPGADREVGTCISWSEYMAAKSSMKLQRPRTRFGAWTARGALAQFHAMHTLINANTPLDA